MHALGFSLNLVLQGDRLDTLAERRVALVFEHAILAFLSEILISRTVRNLDPCKSLGRVVRERVCNSLLHLNNPPS